MQASKYSSLSPEQTRSACRNGTITFPTSGLCNGFVQANVVILDRQFAQDFIAFCEHNPRPCPLLEYALDGQVELLEYAPGSDIRTDLPKYRITFASSNSEHSFEDVTTLLDTPYFDTSRSCTFLLGCSFGFEMALKEAGIPNRNVEQSRNVPMYITNRNCVHVENSVFQNVPLVVSMRPIPANQVQRVVQITEPMAKAHGAPIHVGDFRALGIKDITQPDFGEAVEFSPGDVATFWACGVTGILAARKTLESQVPSRPRFVVTHSPGHMFVTSQRI